MLRWCFWSFSSSRIVFPCVNYKDYFIREAPAGTLGLVNLSGWMTTGLFPKVVAHIIKHIVCTNEKAAVMLMDNHKRRLSLEVVEMARDNGLSVVTFPPGCSHCLQPLDVFFKILLQKCCSRVEFE